MLTYNQALKNNIDSLREKSRGGYIAHPLTAIEQITDLPFIQHHYDNGYRREADTRSMDDACVSRAL